MTSYNHRKYLRKRFYPKSDFPFTGYGLEEQEFRLLMRFGHWFMALDRGWIKPHTDAQRAFVRCCAGEVGPKTNFERLWIRYRNMVNWEALEQEGHDRDAERHDEHVYIVNPLADIDDPEAEQDE